LFALFAAPLAFSASSHSTIQVQVLPSVLIFVGGKNTDRIVGMEDLGRTSHACNLAHPPYSTMILPYTGAH
jgi:hypothetical protein